MVQIFIDCPICSKRGVMEIDENVIYRNHRGITTVSVSKVMCDHSFIAYIDKNFDVRDTFITDFTLASPRLELETVDIDVIPDQTSVNILLITLNIHPITLTYILHACFVNQKILLIHDLNIIHKHVLNFFKFIFPDSFTFNILIMDRSTFQKNRKRYKEYIILDDLKVLNDKNKILKNERYEVERNIINSFFCESPNDLSMIKIKNEITKVFKLSNDVAKYILNLEKKEALNTKYLTRFLEIKHRTKISSKYLKFLIGIVSHYNK